MYMHESSADPGEAYKYIFFILKVEKDMVESQLRKSQAFIASLQAQTQKNRDKATKAEGRWSATIYCITGLKMCKQLTNQICF